MAEGRVYNFSAGPCALPLEILEDIRDNIVNHKGAGMGVMEMSHRSKEYMAIATEAEKNLRDVFSVPDDYKVVFLQGGATLQFAVMPLNFLGGAKTKADYLVTGQWGEKACKEVKKYATSQEACNTKPGKFTTIPDPSEWKLDPEACYVHYCANETVNGVEFKSTPETNGVPLIATCPPTSALRKSIARSTIISTQVCRRTWAPLECRWESCIRTLRLATRR